MLPGMSGIAGLIEPVSVELVHTSSSASETANYGADATGRWIAVLAVGGNAAAPYNLAVTMSGAGNLTKRHSSGDGVSIATGTAIYVGQPSGSSGTVTVTGTTTMRFYVLRVMGYNLGTAVYTDDSTGAGVPPFSANVPAAGLTLSVIQNSNLNAISWTGLTERINDNVIITGKTASAAWDLNMAVDAAKAIGVTSSDANGITSAVIATFNPS